MNIYKHVAVFAFIAVAVPATYLLHAEDTAPTQEERLVALETKVLALETRLSEAYKKITALEAEASRLSKEVDEVSPAPSKRERYVPEGVEVSGPGVGTVLLCKDGTKTLRVGLPALRAHLAQGSIPGACDMASEHARKFGWEKRFTSVDDDEDDDEEEDEEESDE